MQSSLIDKVAWTSFEYTHQPIRALILRFSGLGATGMKDSPDPSELEWSDAGGLVVHPYHEPWAWMNPATRAFIDQLITALLQRHHLPAHTPIIATGGSMGAQGALVFSHYTKHHVVGCLANCPPCDVTFHYSERPDLPRTFHHAYGSYDNIDQALREHSPLHLVATMPKIPYLLLHGGRDQAVAKSKHSDPFAAAMRKLGHQLEYLELPQMAHCNPMDWQTFRRTVDFVKNLIPA